jgi:mono/diheme cytochrome c family protein
MRKAVILTSTLLFAICMAFAQGSGNQGGMMGGSQGGMMGNNQGGMMGGSQGGNSQGGQALFKSQCAMCHGQDGIGNTPVGKSMGIVDLRSPEVQKNTDAQLASITENGKGKMPAYKTKLKPEQVKDLVAYLRALAKSGTAKNK